MPLLLLILYKVLKFKGCSKNQSTENQINILSAYCNVEARLVYFVFHVACPHTALVVEHLG